MRVLVTAASKYGATAEIAAAIAEVLDKHGLEATVLPPEQVKGVDGYDAVVVGSTVYAGHWLKPAGSWSSGTPARWLAGRCGYSPAARSVTRPSPRKTPSTWPTSLAATGPAGSPVVGSRPSNMAWNPATDASPSSPRLMAPAPYHRPGDSPWPDRYAWWSVASSRV